MRRERPERTAQRLEYYERRRAYLKAHPYCQIFIEVHSMIEKEVVECFGVARGTLCGDRCWLTAPKATTIHHRNKRRGQRLNDESEWMSASRFWHDEVERNKAWARSLGLLRNF